MSAVVAGQKRFQSKSHGLFRSGGVNVTDATKGSPHMRHLDIYARRDPQLLPYVIREVDIEYKRQCNKTTFCMWVALYVFLIFYYIWLRSETYHFLLQYAECFAAEQEARDEDATVRRRKFVEFLQLVRDAYKRDKSWSKADTAAAERILSLDEVRADGAK